MEYNVVLSFTAQTAFSKGENYGQTGYNVVPAYVGGREDKHRSTDELDVDRDFPKLPGVREGLHQYYEIEQTTDLWSFNTGRVQAKLGVNKRELPSKRRCPLLSWTTAILPSTESGTFARCQNRP